MLEYKYLYVCAFVRHALTCPACRDGVRSNRICLPKDSCKVYGCLPAADIISCVQCHASSLGPAQNAGSGTFTGDAQPQPLSTYTQWTG